MRDVARFFSHGKLLLTSEYFVLDGALALAIPTKLGQSLECELVSDENNLIYWETFREGKPWLNIIIDYKNLKIIRTNIEIASDIILKIFKTLKNLDSYRFDGKSYKLKSNIQFPENYGLGSSSTLINNISKWAGVNAFVVNDKVFGGSGYDIAVAEKKTPIHYMRNGENISVETVKYSPKFKDKLLFVHLNRKQNSREGISAYRKKDKSEKLVNFLSNLTIKITNCMENIDEFSSLIQEHENIISHFLGVPTVKEKYFEDAPTFFKSLGAWGGDFVLTSKFSGYSDYFQEKGFSVMTSYENLIY